MKNSLVVALVAAGALCACTKNKDGDLVVKTPVVESRTDTMKMPSVEVTRDTITTVTPTVQVKKETSSVTIPHVSVKRKP